jgi:hypothetical protein
MKRAVLCSLAMLGFAILAIAMTPTTANADAILDFGTGALGSSGTLTISGGNAIGASIPIGSLSVIGAPLGNGNYVTSALLSFNTATHTFSILGTISTLGISSSTTLLTGTISGFTLTANGTIASLQATGINTLSASLMAALGLPVNTSFNLFGFTIGANSDGTGSPYEVTSTDFVSSQTPEPATLVLFGSGLLGLAGFVRRRL